MSILNLHGTPTAYVDENGVRYNLDGTRKVDKLEETQNKKVGKDKIAFVQKFKKFCKNYKEALIVFGIGGVMVTGLVMSDEVHTKNTKTAVEQFCNDNDYSLQEGLEILKESALTNEFKTLEKVNGNSSTLYKLEKFNKKLIKQGVINENSLDNN